MLWHEKSGHTPCEKAVHSPCTVFSCPQREKEISTQPWPAGRACLAGWLPAWLCLPASLAAGGVRQCVSQLAGRVPAGMLAVATWVDRCWLALAPPSLLHIEGGFFGLCKLSFLLVVSRIDILQGVVDPFAVNLCSANMYTCTSQSFLWLAPKSSFRAWANK